MAGLDPYARCPQCGFVIDDGQGAGFVRRHSESVPHLLAIDKAQRAAIRAFERGEAVPNFTPWSAIEVGEDGLPVNDELREEEERLRLRAALEALQDEGDEEDGTTD